MHSSEGVKKPDSRFIVKSPTFWTTTAVDIFACLLPVSLFRKEPKDCKLCKFECFIETAGLANSNTIAY